MTRVELASPYGHLYRTGDRAVLTLLNGAKGEAPDRVDWDMNDMVRVRFDDLPDTIVGIPHHWLKEIDT